MTFRDRLHLLALRRRLTYLDDRIPKMGAIREMSYDRAEAAALRWALARLEGVPTVAEALAELRAASDHQAGRR